MAIFEKIRSAERAKLLDEAGRKLEKLEFFVAGPYIDPATGEESVPNNKSSAHRLRHFLNRNLQDKGIVTYLGEDQTLREVGEKEYEEHNNAVLYERHYIMNHLDGVIVLPSSPGSFCEFGDWASDEATAKNTLVIIDQQYKEQHNYINDGVVKSARMNGAQVEYANYENKDEILGLSLKFVQSIAGKRRARNLYGRHR